MPGPDPHPGTFGTFHIEQLVSASGDVQVYRARDEQVDRRVLLRVAGETSAGVLLDDARRLAAVSHPNLVGVLGASHSETGGYAAAPEVDALPLSEVGSLSSEQAARIAIDIAGAIGALSEAGLRAAIDSSTVLVAQTRDGVRGLLDPLRAMSPGQSCLAEADPAASTSELADLVESVVPVPNQNLRRALAGVRSGVSSGPAELASALAPLAASQREAARRRPALVAATCLVLAAIVGAAVVVHQRSDAGSRPGTATSPAPAARIVARIPLGLTGDEFTTSIAIDAGAMWIGTSRGRLLRVDATTNRVVGTPIELGAKHFISDVIVSGGRLFTIDYSGWLLRIDPLSGRVAARRHLGAQLTDAQAAAGVLWITSAEGSKGILIRADPRTLRPIGDPLIVAPQPSHIEVLGSRAWVVGMDASAQVVRVDARSGERRTANVGPVVVTTRLARGTLWIPDIYNGTLSALDAADMTFKRESIRIPESVKGVLPAGSDLWVTAADSLGASGRLRLERFDSRSGRSAGSAVTIGKGDAYALRFDRGSVWALTPTTLVRLTPTMPRPSLGPVARAGKPPRAFAAGPLGAGTWRTTRFEAPFTFSPPAFAWIGGTPATGSVVLLATGGRRAELDVLATRQVFATDTAVRDAGTPASLLEVLRKHPHLLVGEVRHTMIGGRPALQFEVRARRPVKHPEVCGPEPCTFLFPVQNGTIAVARGDVMRLSLLRSSKRTIVISEGGDGDDRVALAATASLLRTFHFKA